MLASHGEAPLSRGGAQKEKECVCKVDERERERESARERMQFRYDSEKTSICFVFPIFFTIVFASCCGCAIQPYEHVAAPFHPPPPVCFTRDLKEMIGKCSQCRGLREREREKEKDRAGERKRLESNGEACVWYTYICIYICIRMHVCAHICI